MERRSSYEYLEVPGSIKLWNEVKEDKSNWDLRLYLKFLQGYIAQNIDSETIDIVEAEDIKLMMKKFTRDIPYTLKNMDEYYTEEYIGIELKMFWYRILKELEKQGFDKQSDVISKQSNNLEEWVQRISGEILYLFSDNLIRKYAREWSGYIRYIRDNKGLGLMQYMKPKTVWRKDGARYKAFLLFDGSVNTRMLYRSKFTKLHNETGKNIDIPYTIVDKYIRSNGYTILKKNKWMKACEFDLPCILVLDTVNGQQDIIRMREFSDLPEEIIKTVCYLSEKIQYYGYEDAIQITKQNVLDKENVIKLGASVYIKDNKGTVNTTVSGNITSENIVK